MSLFFVETNLIVGIRQAVDPFRALQENIPDICYDTVPYRTILFIYFVPLKKEQTVSTSELDNKILYIVTRKGIFSITDISSASFQKTE